MQKDSVSYNNRIIPKDDISYFKNFVSQQDEVPVKINLNGYDHSFLSDHDSLKNSIIVQKKVIGNDAFQKSLFTGSNLQPGDFNRKSIRNSDSDWLLGVFILCLILVAMARVLYSRRLSQVLKAFISPRSVNQISREGNISKESISFLFSAVFFISLSVFIYEALGFYFVDRFTYVPGYLLFALILSGLLLFYILKKGLIRIIGYIFHTKQETRDYQLNTLIFNIITGLFLLPVSFLIYYLPDYHANFVFIFSFVILAFTVIYRAIRSFLIGISLSKFSVFYLFVYLCIVEILPILIILKVVKSY